jgi:hypothetical protein
MKVLLTMVLLVVLMGGLVGCSKTLAELRTNGDAVVDNATGVAGQTLNTVGVIVKKLIGVGFAVYDMGKKVVEDTKDNVVTVKDVVTGASTTPTAP